MKTSALIAAIACTSASAFAPAATSSSRQSALNLAVGETAPDFALVDQNGKTFKRSANKKPLVVYFYPLTLLQDARKCKHVDSLIAYHRCHLFIEVFIIISNFNPLLFSIYNVNNNNITHSVQAKAFQEEIQSIRKEFKADVVGISGQGAESKQKFAQELGLDFSILADEGDSVRKEFGVPRLHLVSYPDVLPMSLIRMVCAQVCMIILPMRPVILKKPRRHWLRFSLPRRLDSTLHFLSKLLIVY